jgi:hypothetical protein
MPLHSKTVSDLLQPVMGEKQLVRVILEYLPLWFASSVDNCYFVTSPSLN